MLPTDPNISTPSSEGTYNDWADRGLERRRQRLAQRKRRNRGIAIGILAAVVLFGVLAGGVALARRWTAGGSALYVPTRSSDEKAIAVAQPIEPASPTPYFAQYKAVKLRLPVAVDDLTEVGFHQASYTYAMKMSTKLPDASSSDAKENGGTGRNKASQAKGNDAWLIGSVLRMWRSRPGKPNSAADVGAKAGSLVFAPADGTVLLVKHYKLYGKYPDYEIHIRPDANASLDLVMIHIKEPVVKAGDRVSAGRTPLGKVRKLSDRIRHQLGRYTGEAGDHTHLQLNDATDSRYKGLKDAPPLP